MGSEIYKNITDYFDEGTNQYNFTIDNTYIWTFCISPVTYSNNTRASSVLEDYQELK